MSVTPKLGIDYLVSGQSLAEITLNDGAINFLDQLGPGRSVLGVLSADPASPAEGDAYIVGPAPAGLFAGQVNKLAFFYAGWHFALLPGFRVWNVAAQELQLWNGAAWVQVNLSAVNTSTPKVYEFPTNLGAGDPWVSPLNEYIAGSAVNTWAVVTKGLTVGSLPLRMIPGPAGTYLCRCRFHTALSSGADDVLFAFAKTTDALNTRIAESQVNVQVVDAAALHSYELVQTITLAAGEGVEVRDNRQTTPGGFPLVMPAFTMTEVALTAPSVP